MRTRRHVVGSPKTLKKYSPLDLWRPTLPREIRRPVPTPLTRILTLKVRVPRSVALKARREVYTYPYPSQRRTRSRSIRKVLRLRKEPYVTAAVRVRVPRHKPLVGGSYVSVTKRRGVSRLNVHSALQLRRLLDAGERNRRRYSERKSNRRHYRNGQLESPGSDAYGIVARAFADGRSIDRLADAALVARAILRGGR